MSASVKSCAVRAAVGDDDISRYSTVLYTWYDIYSRNPRCSSGIDAAFSFSLSAAHTVFYACQVQRPAYSVADFLLNLCQLIYIYNIYIYKAPLREVRRGVAQGRIIITTRRDDRLL